MILAVRWRQLTSRGPCPLSLNKVGNVHTVSPAGWELYGKREPGKGGADFEDEVLTPITNKRTPSVARGRWVFDTLYRPGCWLRTLALKLPMR